MRRQIIYLKRAAIHPEVLFKLLVRVARYDLRDVILDPTDPPFVGLSAGCILETAVIL